MADDDESGIVCRVCQRKIVSRSVLSDQGVAVAKVTTIQSLEGDDAQGQGLDVSINMFYGYRLQSEPLSDCVVLQTYNIRSGRCVLRDTLRSDV